MGHGNIEHHALKRNTREDNISRYWCQLKGGCGKDRRPNVGDTGISLEIISPRPWPSLFFNSLVSQETLSCSKSWVILHLQGGKCGHGLGYSGTLAQVPAASDGRPPCPRLPAAVLRGSHAGPPWRPRSAPCHLRLPLHTPHPSLDPKVFRHMEVSKAMLQCEVFHR